MDVEIVVVANGEEIEVTAKGHYSPEVRGRTYGEADDCYPSEEAHAEVEVILGKDGTPVTFASKEEEETAEETVRQALMLTAGDDEFGFEPDGVDARE